MRGAAFLLAAFALSSLAGTPSLAASHRKSSLIAADWPSDLPAPPCANDIVCYIAVTKAPLVNVATLAGPPVPRKITIRPRWHGVPPPGSRLLVGVWRESGQWHARWLGPVEPGADSCLSVALMAEAGVSAPRQAYRKGEEICFRP
jgi:hypothetical protein